METHTFFFLHRLIKGKANCGGPHGHGARLELKCARVGGCVLPGREVDKRWLPGDTSFVGRHL
eukprot:scaffold7571_cov130-Isochrysis_galbana.AAC.2